MGQEAAEILAPTREISPLVKETWELLAHWNTTSASDRVRTTAQLQARFDEAVLFAGDIIRLSYIDSDINVGLAPVNPCPTLGPHPANLEHRMSTNAPTLSGAGLKLPQNTCAYEEYDLATLEPANDQTRIRLAELGWSEADFKNKTVLDIGANSGLLSLEAHKLGASKVFAYDVQQVLVDFFQEVVKSNKLPIVVEKRSLNDLRAPDDQADVVLFMEVLHWAVSQGTKLQDIINRLVSLTRETLFIEFPWSVEEPSIRAQTSLTSETYAADMAIDLLTRHFKEVRVVGFMHYFGFKSASKRVLLKATGKRLESSVLTALPEARPLDISLPHGRNQNRIVHSPEGCFFVKQVASASILQRISSEVTNNLFDTLRATGAQRIMLPKRLGGSYLVRGERNMTFLVMPLVGGLSSLRAPKRPQLQASRFLDFLVALRGELRNVSPAVIAGFRRIDAPSRLMPNWDSDLWDLPICAGEARTQVADLLRVIQSDAGSSLDSLQHGDIQSGNLLVADDGGIIAIDLDSISLGTPYSDGLAALTWQGADVDSFRTFVKRCRIGETRDINSFDVAYVALRGAKWLKIVTSEKLVKPDAPVITRFLQGFTNLLELEASIRPPR